MATTEGSRENPSDLTLPNRLIGVTVTRTAMQTIYESVTKALWKNNYELVLHDSLMNDKDRMYQSGYDAFFLGWGSSLEFDPLWRQGFDDAEGDSKVMDLDDMDKAENMALERHQEALRVINQVIGLQERTDD